jgi:hypothetical protein
MAHRLENRVAEASTSAGTGPFVVSGALTAFNTFASRMAVGDTCWLLIEAVDGNGNLTGQWVRGLGTYSAANTLTLTAALESNAGMGVGVSFAAGTKRVSMTIAAPGVDTAGQWLDKLGIGEGSDAQFSAAWSALTAGDALLRVKLLELKVP